MARLNEAAIEGELEVLRAEWDKLAGPVIERRGLAQAATREADERLRAGALNFFQRDGAKDLGFGVAIREITRLEYDPAVALVWAKAHDLALSLDRRVFERVVKATTAPDFVEVTVEPQVTVAQDLGPHVGVESTPLGSAERIFLPTG